MRVSKQSNTLIIIPAFNEEKNIGVVVDELINIYHNMDILVINDGSSDKTAQILQSKKIFTVEHIFNMGIGTAFQTGCKFAEAFGYDYIVRLDGDGQHNPTFINDILMPVRNNQADITIGSRFLGGSDFKSSIFRLFGIQILSLVLGVITKKKITDPTSGFCAMDRAAFEFFARNCIEDYPEPEIALCSKSFRIKEVPIKINRRQGGVSSITPMKSIYYMYKVLLSSLIRPFRGEEI